MPEVYGIRLPPPAQRLTAPNFSIVPRSAGPPAPDGAETVPQIDPSLGGMLGEIETATRDTSEAGEGNLFGDDDDEEEDDEDDEEMEDVTAGLPQPTTNGSSSSSSALKRKADEDEEYD